MKKIIIILLAISCLTASAQMYRMVNGNIYRADDLSVWRTFSNLRIVRVAANGALLVQEVSYNNRVHQTGQNRGYGAQTTSSENLGEIFVLKNYRSYQAPYPGMNIGFVRAMLVPPPEGRAVGMAIYDMGTPWYPPQKVLTPAQIAAQKAIAASNIVVNLKIEATNGDVVGQCELGEHYMTGIGVRRDTVTGQMWLKKSADQGDIEASNYLQNFTLTNNATAQK